MPTTGGRFGSGGPNRPVPVKGWGFPENKPLPAVTAPPDDVTASVSDVTTLDAVLAASFGADAAVASVELVTLLSDTAIRLVQFLGRAALGVNQDFGGFRCVPDPTTVDVAHQGHKVGNSRLVHVGTHGGKKAACLEGRIPRGGVGSESNHHLAF